MPRRGQSVVLTSDCTTNGGHAEGRCCSGTCPSGGLSMNGVSTAAILLSYGRALVHITGPLCSLPPPRGVHEEWWGGLMA